MRKLLTALLATAFCASLSQAQVLYSGQSIPSRGPVPADSIGVENSWYLDLLTGNVYGPKTLGRWPTPPAAYIGIAQNIPITGFGAKFDALTYKDGTITAGSTTFTSQSATFTSADCNSGPNCTGLTDKVIDIDFAGASGNAPLHTTIRDVIDAHTVTLATPALATIGYNYVWGWVPTTLQSGAGSYAPGDTVTLSGGTYTSQATALIRATKVTSATIVSGGSGGIDKNHSDTGTCYVQGTTGTGYYFIASLELTAGVATSVNSIITAGQYTVNPTTPASEPVLPVTNCSGLTGAVLSVNLGPTVLASANHAAMGQYSALPAFPAATTTSGSGTGLTLSPITYRAGNFIYGTDDTLAWTTAFNTSAAKNRLGQFNCLIMPGGASIVTSTLPAWRGVAPCLHGQSRDKSLLFLAASYSGPALQISNAWIDSTQNTPSDGALTPVTSIPYGTDLADFTILGTRFAPQSQQAIIFSDNNDFITVSRLMLRGLNSTCFGMGRVAYDTRAYTRESNFNDMQLQYCGSSSDPGFYIDAASASAADDLFFKNINVYGSGGTAMDISTTGTGRTANIQFDRLRLEGLEFSAENNIGDLLKMGDNTKTGQVNGITIINAEFIDEYLGGAAVHMAGAGGLSNYGNSISGFIGGGVPYGEGLFLESARNNRFYFSTVNTPGPNVHFATNAGAGNEVTGPSCLERSWTYVVEGQGIPSSKVCYYNAKVGGGQPNLAMGAADGTISSGNIIGQGSVNLSLFRVAPWQVPAGQNAVSIGSADTWSTGNSAIDIGARFGILTGDFSSAIGSYAPIDHGWSTSRILSGWGTFGTNQLQEVLLGCKTAATNGATCRLTSDGTGTASTTNVANPQANTSYAANLICNAHDGTNNTNSIAWLGVPALLLTQASAGTTVGSFGAIPTPLSIGTVTGSTLTVSADTTNGGATLTFAAPTTNSAVWNITCQATTVQTQ